MVKKKEDDFWFWIILFLVIIGLVLIISNLNPQEPPEQDSGCDIFGGMQLVGDPDFSGTPREGEGCIDDLDCINHPPKSYSGLGEIVCCTERCYWMA